MPDFTRAAALAKRLIEASGRSVTLYKLDRTPDDPTKPWRGTDGPPSNAGGGKTIPAIAAFVPASGSGMGKMVADAGGSLSVAFDQVALLATGSIPAGVTPDDIEECDSMLDETAGGSEQVWKIVTRGHLRPASESIMFVLGVKR